MSQNVRNITVLSTEYSRIRQSNSVFSWHHYMMSPCIYVGKITFLFTVDIGINYMLMLSILASLIC